MRHERWVAVIGTVALLLVSAGMLVAAGLQRTTLTHTLSAREKAALEVLIQETSPLSARTPVVADAVTGEVKMIPRDVTPEDMAEWHARLIDAALRPYLDRLDAEKTKDAAAEIRDLSPEECTALNATRKKAGKPVLRRCGKGGGNE